MDHSIVPVQLVVKSMRDNGYKNTAYAIAELIDNSIQHWSSLVDLICLEHDELIALRTVSRIKEIAILDNGNGMNAETLQKALQFGNGTNLNKEEQTSIGKFGMGLPSSSISQAVRVDVWSWQNGYQQALHTYIDVKEISDGKLTDVPEPAQTSIPVKYVQIADNLGKSGTLVVWTKLDRCLWRTGRTIIEHSEYLVGRMYRKFIHSGDVKIRATVVREANLSKPEYTTSFLANDPLYLMDNTSVSKQLAAQGLPDPMFFKYGGDIDYEVKYPVKYQGETHIVYVRYAVAFEAARKGRNPGGLPHGKHAGGNVGVSILRAGRELDLDTSWVISYDPVERWWGIEVEFPPALDEVFGVTNNKQYANNFRELGSLNLTQELRDRGQSIFEFKEELLAEDDPKAYLIDIAKDIKNQLKNIRETLDAQQKRLAKDPSPTRHEEETDLEAEKHASEVTESRREDGYIGQSDKDEASKTDEEKETALANVLADDNVEDPLQLAKEILKEKSIKYQFIESNFESPAFFSVTPVAGKIIIKLNTTHPAYNQFVEILNDNIEHDTSIAVLRQRLIDAKTGLKLLLMAWARYEDEQPGGRLKDAVKDARQDWGKMASAFMSLED
jgi:DNA-binding phage protein